MTNPSLVWDGVLRRLGADMSSFALEAWMRPLGLALDEDGAALLCPTSFHRDRVRERFLSVIERQLALELGRHVAVNPIVGSAPEEAITAPVEAAAVDGGRAAALAPQRRHETGASAAPAALAPPSRPSIPRLSTPRAASGRARPRAHGREPEQIELPYSFDTFVVGDCNALARHASLAVAQGRQRRANPLFLVSAEGLGKTHLARAIVGEARASGGGRVVYASAEAFTSDFMASIRSKQMDRFKRRYRTSDLLVFEDVQFLSSKTATQLELFHTLMHLLDTGRRVVLSGDRLPFDIDGIDARLRSQMSAGLVAELEPPDAVVRRKILRGQAASAGVRVPDDCLDLLVDSLRGSVRDLQGVLVQMIASSSLLKCPIDRALTESALRTVAPARLRAKRLTCVEVVDVVAAFFSTSPDALASRARSHDVLHPRQLAMYLCRRYTDATLSEIARHFRRDHPAVSNAMKVVEKRLLEGRKTRYQVEQLSSRLESQQTSR